MNRAQLLDGPSNEAETQWQGGEETCGAKGGAGLQAKNNLLAQYIVTLK